MLNVHKLRQISVVPALLACALSAQGCKFHPTAQSTVKTDLGPAGNQAVVKDLLQYQAKPASAHCDDAGNGFRVIFTGFSVFQDFPYNISGTVVRAMANPSLWPDQVTLDQFTPTGTASLGATSFLTPSDYGGIASQRQLSINGQPFTVCFVLLEVVWDQAAGIIMTEAQHFHPNAIIMTGGGVTDVPNLGQFEAGALNDAYQMPGYNGTNGDEIDVNTPVLAAPSSGDITYILPPTEQGVQETVPMQWNNVHLAAVTQPVAAAIRRGSQTNIFSVMAEPAARTSNNYLCNNTSYVILNALKGIPLNLAGGQFRAFPSGPGVTTAVPTPAAATNSNNTLNNANGLNNANSWNNNVFNNSNALNNGNALGNNTAQNNANSYVSTNSLNNMNAQLATSNVGGSTYSLDLGNSMTSAKFAGFFHIPDTQTDEAQTMLGWAKVFATVMVTMAQGG